MIWAMASTPLRGVRISWLAVVGVQPRQEVVEAVGQPADLVVGVDLDAAVVAAVLGDRLHGPGQPLHRLDRPRRQPLPHQQRQAGRGEEQRPAHREIAREQRGQAHVVGPKHHLADLLATHHDRRADHAQARAAGRLGIVRPREPGQDAALGIDEFGLGRARTAPQRVEQDLDLAGLTGGQGVGGVGGDDAGQGGLLAREHLLLGPPLGEDENEAGGGQHRHGGQQRDAGYPALKG